jgi:16S rRNA (guanine1207-N2)-methyltransferase
MDDYADDYFIEKVAGTEIKFYTRAGIFSQQGLDNGSRMLVEKADIKDGTLICDLGCGGGVIGMAAAKLNPEGHVHLLDANIRAITLTEENVALNRVKNVEVYLSDLFSAVPLRTYHTILSNPPQHLGNDFLEECAKECFDHLKTGGKVYWVVQARLSPLVERLFKNYFQNYKIEAHSKEYALISAKKEG